MEIVGKLTREQFMEWRLELDKLQMATLQRQLVTERLQSKHLMSKIHSLELEVAKKTATEAHVNEKYVEKTYKEEFLVEFEKKIGFSIRNKVVNDVTLEVTDIDVPVESK
jgi:hypothetical protein